jgi:hypothetical protein
MSPEKLIAGTDMNVMDENIVAYIDSDTTHHGNLPPARKYASLELLRRINQNPIPAIASRYAIITTISRQCRLISSAIGL